MSDDIEKLVTGLVKEGLGEIKAVIMLSMAGHGWRKTYDAVVVAMINQQQPSSVAIKVATEIADAAQKRSLEIADESNERLQALVIRYAGLSKVLDDALKSKTTN